MAGTAGFLAEAFSAILYVPTDIISQRLRIQSETKGGPHMTSLGKEKKIRTWSKKQGTNDTVLLLCFFMVKGVFTDQWIFAYKIVYLSIRHFQVDLQDGWHTRILPRLRGNPPSLHTLQRHPLGRL